MTPSFRACAAAYLVVVAVMLATSAELRRRAPAECQAAAERWLRAHRAAWGSPGSLPRSLRCVTPHGGACTHCEARDPSGSTILHCHAAPARCAPARRP